MSTSPQKEFTTVLATAQIKLIGQHNVQCTVRALHDEGAEASFVTQDVVRNLNLPRQRSIIPLTGIGAAPLGTAQWKSEFRIQSIHDPGLSTVVNAIVLPKLTTSPSTSLPRREMIVPPDLKLADPEFYEPKRISIILGVEIYSQILRTGIRHLLKGRRYRFLAKKSIFFLSF